MHSCKGRASAFAFPSNLDWTGLVFTWSLAPNIDYLMDNGVSVYALSPYRNYLMSEQVVVVVSIKNDDEIDDNQVVREYMHLVEAGFKPKNVVHLGKTWRRTRILKR